LNRLILYLVGLLIIILLVIFFYNNRGELQFILSDKAKSVDAFRDYSVEKDFGKGYYRVAFKDLITSTGRGTRSYYRYNLSVETDDKKSAKELIQIRKQAIAIINGVMTRFPPEDMDTEAKRKRVKSIMQEQIGQHYPEVRIKEIYFTEFLYD